MQKDSYAHVIGRIKVRETKCLDSNIINRLIDEPQIESFYRILDETEYGQFMNLLSQEEKNISNITNYAYKNLKKFLMEASPEPEKINIFYYKYDFHNLKLLFKNNYIHGIKDPDLIDFGTVDPDRLKEYFHSENNFDMQNEFYSIIQIINNKFKDNFDPLYLDIFIDKLYFDFISKKIIKFNENFLEEWLKIQIDFANIKTYMRIENLHESEELYRLSEYLIPGGNISENIYTDCIDDYQAFINKLHLSPYSHFLPNGINYYLENKSFSLLEKLMDNYTIDFAKQSKFFLFGIEPVIGYILAKEQEIKILRIILTCKINELPIETIKERVGEVYG